MNSPSEESGKRRDSRHRQSARALLLEGLSENGGWRDPIRGFEDDPLVKLLVAAIEDFRHDLEKPGGIVYPLHSGSSDHIGSRHLPNRVRKHFLPILKELPIGYHMVESLKFLDPTDYLRIEKEIEECMELPWELWSHSQKKVADVLIMNVFRPIQSLHKALSSRIRFCRMCPKQTVDEKSDFCKDHHPKMSPAGYMAGRRKTKKNRNNQWKKEIAILSFWHAQGKPSVKEFDSSGKNISAKQTHFLRSSWPEVKKVFLESLKAELPMTYKKISGPIEKTNSWKEAIDRMGECLEDPPPKTENSTIIFSWLRAAESWFESNLTEKSTKSGEIRKMLSQGYNQSEVAKKLGVSRQLVSHIACKIARRP